MRLVGRTRELRRVERLLERGLSGSGGALVVVGPEGAGKTALLDAAAETGGRMGFEVVRVGAGPHQPLRLVWAQLVRDVRGGDDLARRLLDDPAPLDLDELGRVLAAGGPRLLVIDDLDEGGRECCGVLGVVEPRVRPAPVVVLAASSRPLGVAPELRLAPLAERDIAALVPGLPGDAQNALWLASRGLPGSALSLVDVLEQRREGADAVVHLALHAPSAVGFLGHDVNLIRLLEDALGRSSDVAVRARLLARLAAALLGDPAASARRRVLADEALQAARASQDSATLAEVLISRLHALWDPAGAVDRLVAGAEIVELGRAVGDRRCEREGLFWRFVALMELGRVAEAESALSAFARDATDDGDAEALAMATARRAMLAILRGRYAEAEDLVAWAVEQASAAGMADAANVGGALRAAIAVECDAAALEDLLPVLSHMVGELPGHFYEATAARMLITLGRNADASVELQRVLSRALAGAGPRWVGAMADLATVAVAVGDRHAATQLYDALLPYEGRLVVFGGAVTVWGPVCHYLGRLALVLSLPDDALAHLQVAVEQSEQIGALPALVHALDALADAIEAGNRDADRQQAAGHRERARDIATKLGMAVFLRRLDSAGVEWTLLRDGEDWLLDAGEERARLRHGRGVEYLRALLASPGRDLSALDLAAGGAGMNAFPTEHVLDEAALRSYRHRLQTLEEELDSADVAGDVARARRVAEERDFIAGELRRAVGMGGRARRASAEAERARVNVTRTLRSTIERLEAAAPRAAAHLGASIRTGLACRYDPAPGGPDRWRV